MRYLVVIFALLSCARGKVKEYSGFRQQALPRGYNPHFVLKTDSGSIVPIRSQYLEISADGSYSWSYKTGNGILAAESGAPKTVPGGAAEMVEGYYSYTAPDGSLITVQYTADENGYHPTVVKESATEQKLLALSDEVASLHPTMSGFIRNNG